MRLPAHEYDENFLDSSSSMLLNEPFSFYHTALLSTGSSPTIALC